ncbi:hypothetical protein ACVMB0_007671 [Bradyrhizobium sp. USDA 4451]
MKHRVAVEPVIGHVEPSTAWTDFLKGRLGDGIHAVLAVTG